ncbi:MAG: hypothetical protein WCO86_08870 [Planctomycetota bacterium]
MSRRLLLPKTIANYYRDIAQLQWGQAILRRAWFSLSQRTQRVANATPLPAMSGLPEVPFIVVSSVRRTSVHPYFSDFESKQIWALTQSDRQLVKVQ